MREVRKFPAVDERVETGPIQFGDDWPGIFIRGDNAIAYAFFLGQLLDHPTAWNARANAEGLIRTLRSCDMREPKP